MKPNSSLLVSALYIAIIVYAALGCIQPVEKIGPLQNESSAVSIGGAKTANVQVVMGLGELFLEGGAKDLMDASFIYNIASWKPEVSYTTSNDAGSLAIKQPAGGGASLSGDVSYQWIVRLNDAVPLNLSAILGTGDARLSLGGMTLTGLDVKAGASNLTLNLSGPWKRDLNASITSGVGDLTIILPRKTGAVVDVRQGIGSIEAASGLVSQDDTYMNEAYRNTSTTLRVTVTSGVGRTRLWLEP
ncbi:MAG: hypothetical protein A4E48_00218 [Methanosaeta sp. PtaU1.Bin060]|nr:MAG: hypothetical protein A4E48_00218 [Methanosaeta sp. PtaU1.Bin060]